MPVKLYDRTTSNLFKIGGLLLLLVVLIAGAQAQQTQTFTSGSTGVDGALDYSVLLPNGGVVIFDPTKFNPPLNPAGDNIFNFTTINIPANVTVRLSGRVLKGPVYWLASGDVTIDGAVDLRGEDGAPIVFLLGSRQRAMPGAGGFSGGVGGKTDGSAASPVAQPGDGPGGGPAATGLASCNDGQHSIGQSGNFTGNPILVPLIGGSGGGGGNAIGDLVHVPYGSGGGAGGGAILIASSTSITVNGSINANGGDAGTLPNCGAVGGGGSGGAIRLASPTLNGNGSLSALGGQGHNGPGSNGALRLEAFTVGFSGSVNGSPFTYAAPVNTFLPTSGPPSIAITNINGTDISQPPTGNLATPDVVINTSSPVSMTIQAKFIPPGTIITLHVFSDNNTDQAVQTTPLVGTLQSSTATANVTFPSGFSLQFVKATWTQ